MISKVVPNRGGRSAARTLAYIADGRGGATGEKVEWLRTRNCLSTQWDDARDEIVAVQALNTRAKHKTYHFILSLRAGETLAPSQWDQAVEKAVAALGLSDHQRVAALHRNTGIEHLHVVVNLVHPETLKAVQPAHDFRKLRTVCAELEHEYGLVPVDAVKNKRNGNPTKANDMKVHAGVEPFLEWLRANAAATLLREVARDGATWATVQSAAHEYGVEFRTRGDGLVIAHMQRRLFVKASDVDRGLSRGRIEAALGPFDKDAAKSDMTPGIEYRNATAARGTEARMLFERFQKQKQTMRDARRKALDDLRTRFRAAMADADKENAAWRAKNRPSVRANDDVAKAWDRAHRLRISAIRKQWKAERLRVASEHPALAWRAWLVTEADRGDPAAQTVLDKLKNRKSRGQERTGDRGR